MKIMCSFCYMLSCVQMVLSHAEELDLSYSKHSAFRRIRPHSVNSTERIHGAKATLIYICTYVWCADLYSHTHTEKFRLYNPVHQLVIHIYSLCNRGKTNMLPDQTGLHI